MNPKMLGPAWWCGGVVWCGGGVVWWCGGVMTIRQSWPQHLGIHVHVFATLVAANT